jgi:hypothetical protein
MIFFILNGYFFLRLLQKLFGSFHLPEPLGNAMGIILTNEK